MRHLSIYAVLMLFVVLHSFASGADTDTLRIHGKVVDSKGLPLPGVRVAIYGAKAKIVAARETSGKPEDKGCFDFGELNAGEPYDIVFIHSRYQMAVVSRLAGKHPQHLNKVLYRKGEGIPSLAFQEYTSSARRLLLMAATSGNAGAFLEDLTTFEPLDPIDRMPELLDGDQLIRSVIEIELKGLTDTRDLVLKR